ncbi:hypothetical protein NDU88_001724 [Pleurodeles waltl]|uniref:Reverse transcriptase domain-containing protein n=1 Tax=Pleurodeles waltl TaxID=8319 RepID=A0AAV7RBP8_PLEWA|nr:hypothetical protein NDU88_001724 [Pleurodeles waltl]
MVILHKPDHDPLDVRSYQPLSLLSIGCKVLGKVLANKLTQVVGECENWFILGKNTILNIRLLIMECTLTDGDALVAMLLDIEKAFDIVGCWFLEVVLERMGFGPGIIRLIGLLYVEPVAKY